MNGERIAYLDSSAIVKLVVHEDLSVPLRTYMRRRGPLASSAIARAEVLRAVRRWGESGVRSAEAVLTRIDLLRVNDRILDAAGALGPADLRTLDAIHLASAADLGDLLAAFITYDDRLGAAARAMGWRVVAPA